MAAATTNIAECPHLARFFVMILQPGNVFLLANYRHHDECAVRKREASVNICMASDQGEGDRYQTRVEVGSEWLSL
jgi:hypothetical protein